MSARRTRLRTVALLAGAGYALHQLRFAIGYGGSAHHELAAQGHAYMTVVAPLVAAALLLAVGELGARLAHGSRPGSTPSLRRLWALASPCLLVAYLAQESAEGMLAAGHPAGAAAAVTRGGAIAIPLAAVMGLVVALLLRASQRALELAAEPPVRVRPPRLPPARRFAAVLAGHPLRGAWRPVRARGPPLASSVL